jgi:hypothetical protein
MRNTPAAVRDYNRFEHAFICFSKEEIVNAHFKTDYGHWRYAHGLGCGRVIHQFAVIHEFGP